MPKDAIAKVNQHGSQQNMPMTLTFADQFGFELPDVKDDMDDDHDSDYDPDNDDNDKSNEDTANLTASCKSSTHSSDDDDDNDNDKSTQSIPELTTGVDSDGKDSNDDSDDSDDDDNNPEVKKEDNNDDAGATVEDGYDSDIRRATINIPDDMTGPPATVSNTGVGSPLQMRTMNMLKMQE
jgi:hypothetical protein